LVRNSTEWDEWLFWTSGLDEYLKEFQCCDLPGIGTAVEAWHAANVDRSERAVCNQEADHVG